MTILHYFPAFRALERELAEVSSRLILAEDQVRLWRSRCESAEDREQRTADSERRALKMVANCESVRSGSNVVPFPDCYVPMPEPPREEVTPEPRRRQPREVIQQYEREFGKEYADFMDRQMAEEG